MTDYSILSTKFRKFFELPSSPVAVNINHNGSEPENSQPMRFCEMVRRSAVFGETFKFDVEGLSCASAELALGFTEPSYGEVYPRIKPAKTHTITITPLEKTETDPDVVIVVGNPRKIMKISTVVAQLKEKQPLQASFKGEFAVCGECTAIPYQEKRTNLSLLCSGARLFAGYRDDEIVMGFPLKEFITIAEATEEKEITSALCGCIMDDLPAHTIQAIEKIGFQKGTDQFFGRFDQEIIRLYTPKDEKGKINTITLHLPLKYTDKKTAEKANQQARDILQSPFLHQSRDNWLDVVLLLELGENLNRATTRGEKFETTIKQGINAIINEANKLKRKTMT